MIKGAGKLVVNKQTVIAALQHHFDIAAAPGYEFTIVNFTGATARYETEGLVIDIAEKPVKI